MVRRSGGSAAVAARTRATQEPKRAIDRASRGAALFSARNHQRRCAAGDGAHQFVDLGRLSAWTCWHRLWATCLAEGGSVCRHAIRCRGQSDAIDTAPWRSARKPAASRGPAKAQTKYRHRDCDRIGCLRCRRRAWHAPPRHSSRAGVEPEGRVVKISGGGSPKASSTPAARGPEAHRAWPTSPASRSGCSSPRPGISPACRRPARRPRNRAPGAGTRASPWCRGRR